MDHEIKSLNTIWLCLNFYRERLLLTIIFNAIVRPVLSIVVKNAQVIIIPKRGRQWNLFVSTAEAITDYIESFEKSSLISINGTGTMYVIPDYQLWFKSGAW